ncbi:MAG: hypothetical protein GY822_23120 [Deltaproteobacteria bacterium]|nr:hypothetical protein [Deltaproteobacteria bacterium]
MPRATRAPAILQETPKMLPEDMRRIIETGLNEKNATFLDEGERIRVAGRRGKKAAFLQARVGNETLVMQFEVFARDFKGTDFDGPVGAVVDFLDGVLDEYFDEDREAYLPLDFTAHPYENGFVFARQEKRNFAAEEAGDALLAKPVNEL